MTSWEGSDSVDARRVFVTGAVALVAFALILTPRPATGPMPATNAQSKVPLSFVPNRGQTDARVRYYAQTPGFAAYFTRDGVTIALSKGQRGHALQLRFRGANPNPAIGAGDRRHGRVNYFTASERHTNIPTYGTLAYRNLWPGIDLVFAGRRGGLKYEFRLGPGADPADIRLAYRGGDSMSLTRSGGLATRTRLGTLIDAAPRSHQAGAGAVASRFVLHGGRSYGFALGPYDHRRPLVIDPQLEYSGLLGGSGYDAAFDVAADDHGSAYVVGTTESPGFPTTPGAFDSRLEAYRDAFVTKLSPSGSSIEYSTFIGGSGGAEARGVAVDRLGNAYVTGIAYAGFPTTPGAFDRTEKSGFDAFVTKLDPTGSSLVFSTLLGGRRLDYGIAIAVDAQGFVYAGGHTSSEDFPTTPGAFDRTFGGDYDPFVTKLSPDGSSLVYSTLVGTSLYDILGDMAIDKDGNAYITGQTRGTDFPVTPGAFQGNLPRSSGGAFVTKLNATGTGLAYSALLSPAAGFGIAVDRAGAAYVTGATGNGFPTTPGAFDTTFNGDADAFVTKLAPSGGSLEYSTYLGGGVQAPCCLAPTDYGFGIAVDWRGSAYVTGYTGSEQFPVTPDAFQKTRKGGDDQFLTKFDPSGSAVTYSTFLGGYSREGFSAAVALDLAGGAYVSGSTSSVDFPTTQGAFDNSFHGAEDAFVTKFDFGAGPPATLVLDPKTATNTVDAGGHCVIASVRDIAGDPTPDVTVTFTVAGATSVSGTQTTAANGDARFCYQGPELPGIDEITASVDPGGPSDTATKTWALPPDTEGCKVSGEGRITARNGDRATFSNEVRAKSATDVKGRARYTDQGPAATLGLTSKTIDALVCEGRRATIFGHADSAAFRVDLNDLGRRARSDTYRVLLGTGYDSGTQTVERGDIKVRG